MLAQSVALTTEEPIVINRVRYRADVMLNVCGHLTVIECDGKDFHKYKPDLERDVLMLDLGGVDEIARFRGCDVMYEPDGLVRFLQRFCPHLFDVDAEPLMLHDQVVASLSLQSAAAKPIYRRRARTEEAANISDELKGLPTYRRLGRLPDYDWVIVQMQDTNWNRAFTGHRVSPFSDCIAAAAGLTTPILPDVETPAKR